MSQLPATPSRPPLSAGLCHSCAFARVIATARGSVFVLCRLSADDARFPKYPPLPMRACDGYAAISEGGDVPGE